MSNTSSILKLNKMALLMGTCLVAAGCAGTTDMQSDASTGTPIAQKSDESPKVSKKGMTQETLMRIGARAWKKGNASTALRLYGMASQKNPKDPAPLLAMAEILRKTKKPGAAIELYKRILETAPDTLEAHNGIGYAFLKQDKPYMAAQSFETAIALAPQDPKALGGMGVALDTAGEHSKAQDFYRLAIKEAPNNLTYQNNLALSLALAGRTEQAIAMLEIITAHPKATARHRQNLALVYGMAGKSAEAMRYSRMDLNERDARNNALYFQALTNNASRDLAEKQDQADLMASRENARFRDPSTSRQPYSPLNAHDDDTELSVEPRAEEEVEGNPHFVNPSERQASRQPHENIAKTPATAEQLIGQKPTEEEQDYAPISAAPIPEVERELLMQPAQFKPVEETKEQSQAVEETTSFAQTRPQRSTTPQDYSQMVSRKRSVSPRPTSQNLQYFAQLGSFRTKERAIAGWQVLMERHFDLLSEQPLVISKVELGDNKGIFYRIRVGAFDERDIPDQLCKMLISRAQGCYTPQVATTSIRFSAPPVPERNAPVVADEPEAPSDPDKVTATNISYAPFYRPRLKKYDASLIAF